MVADLSQASIVVAVHNGESTIGRCIESLLELVWCTPEIVVVENGSTDGTRRVLDGFGDRIRVIQESKRGPAAARNAGIRAATGDCVAITDADCVVDRQWLSNLTEPLADPRVGVAGGRIESVEPCNRIERFGDRIHDHHAAIEGFERPYVISMNWASPKSILFEAGLFDETLLRGSDVDLSWRIHSLGYRLVYVDGAVVRHRNESTWRGLFNEGLMHGAGSERVHARQGIENAGEMNRIARRIGRRFGSLVSGRGISRFDALCSIVFDAGKVVGKHSARGARVLPD